MRVIYIDSEFKCHVSGDESMMRVETGFFDGRCDTFIEGYRFIPDNETWVRADGIELYGETIIPWKEYFELDDIQREYENKSLSECMEAFEIIKGERRDDNN